MTADPDNSLCSELWNNLARVRAPLGCHPRKYLFHYGDAARGLYIVEKGTVNLLLASESGAEQLFETVGPGALLGLSEAISGSTHKLTAIATTEVEVSFIDRQQLLSFLRQNPSCCMKLVRLLSEDLHTLYYRFQSDRGGGSKGQGSEVSTPPRPRHRTWPN